MLKAVIFDFDGVIVDSEPLHYRAIHRVTEAFGVRFTYDEYADRLIGFDDRDAIRVALGGVPGSDDALPDNVALGELCDRKTEAFGQIVTEGIAPIAGAVSLIDSLAGRVPIAIASGAVRREIDLCLKQLKLDRHFPVIVSADQVEHSKPDPQTYRLAVEQLSHRHPDLSLSPGDIVAIEDTSAGIVAARGANLNVLALTSTNPRDRLLDAHRVVDTLEGVTLDDLRTWFA